MQGADSENAHTEVILPEESWHQARLIPTSGITGPDEQERRATSALLAVLGAVREFSRSLLSPLGAPAGKVETYIEVPFELGDKRCYPDGLIRVTRGRRQWVALVEVKTGRSALHTEQLEDYLDIAKEQGFDALVTVSNEIPSVAGQHPTKVDKRKLRKVALHHWSWTYILSTAVVQKEHRGVTDPDQAWILGELIRYLEHPRSGALELEDMGPEWVSIRQSIRAGILRATDKGVSDVAARFDALLRYTSLMLGRKLGTDVSHVIGRKERTDPRLRSQSLLESLIAKGELRGAIRVPDAVADMHVVADLRSSLVTCYVDIDAPRTGRPTTRVNWLVRQLRKAPDTLRLEAYMANARGASAAELLSTVRGNPACLVIDSTRDLRSFRIAMSRPMGLKRGRGRGAFIDSLVDLVDTFYAEVVQCLKPWTASPPRMREEPGQVEPTTPASLSSTALSSQDEPDIDGYDGMPTEGDREGAASASEVYAGSDLNGTSQGSGWSVQGHTQPPTDS